MTTYPTLDLPAAPDFDWPRLLAHWVRHDPYQPEDGTARYYETKARIAHHLHPRLVVEIGVRAGYSALAFHMGWPFTEYLGFDKDEGTMGGVSGYLSEAQERLLAIDGLWVDLHRVDTQSITRLPAEAHGADLFHVDGDHTPAGCAHDIMLALTSRARWILVDDYDYTDHVRDAADFVVQKRRLNAWHIPDGYRGNLLIEGIS